jgi:hypothetical protein
MEHPGPPAEQQKKPRGRPKNTTNAVNRCLQCKAHFTQLVSDCASPVDGVLPAVPSVVYEHHTRSCELAKLHPRGLYPQQADLVTAVAAAAVSAAAAAATAAAPTDAGPAGAEATAAVDAVEGGNDSSQKLQLVRLQIVQKLRAALEKDAPHLHLRTMAGSYVVIIPS